MRSGTGASQPGPPRGSRTGESAGLIPPPCMPASDARTHRACGFGVLARGQFPFGFCRLVILLLGLALSGAGRAAEAKPEVIFQLPLAPSGLTIMPDGGFLISVSFEEKPQNRVIAVGRTGESK